MDFNDLNVDDIKIVGEDTSSETDTTGNSDAEQNSTSEDTDASEDNAVNSDDADSESQELGSDKGEEEATEVVEDNQVDLDTLLKEKTDGRIESVDSISEMLTKLDQLEEESKKVPELQFPSDRAKRAYDFIVNREGEFEELTTQIHHALALGDPNNMEPKHVQMEAFLIERPDLSRSKGEKLFNARYEKYFGDMDEDDIILQDEHDRQTKSAIETIQKMQENIKSAKVEKEAKDAEKLAEEDAKKSIEVAKSVEDALREYKGVEYAFGEDKFTINLENELREELHDAMVNPASVIEKALENFRDGNGNFDWKKYADYMLGIIAKSKSDEKIYNQGIVAGQLIKLKEGKNLSTDRADSGAAAPKTETELDAWINAANKR